MSDARLRNKTRITVLKDIAEALNETNDVSAAMDAILPRLGDVMGLSTAWAFRFDPQRRSFVEVGASGLPPALACNNAAPLKTGWCECQDQFVAGKLNKAVNIVRCSRLRDAEGDKRGLVFHASIPLRSKDKALGILNVAASGHGVFTEDALALLGAIGHQVAIAIDRAALLGRERQRAQRLRALSDLAGELLPVKRAKHMLDFAVRRFVEMLNYEACGITMPLVNSDGERTERIVAMAARPVSQVTSEYSYASDEDNVLLPDDQRLLLDEARSALDKPIPDSDYRVRLESSQPRAFSDIDDDILDAFAWHLAAALESALVYEQSLANAKWAERRKLAADLHDAVSQKLFSAQLLAKTALMQLNEQEPTASVESTVTRLQLAIREAQAEMRALMNALRPAHERGFTALLREHVDLVRLHGNTRVQWIADDSVDGMLTFTERENLLAVAQEALQNALKHAGARNIVVRVEQDGTVVRMSVLDDGCGFDESSVVPGLGTSTMYERMRSLGGRLHLRSRPGDGTAVICEVPVRRGE